VEAMRSILDESRHKRQACAPAQDPPAQRAPTVPAEVGCSGCCTGVRSGAGGSEAVGKQSTGGATAVAGDAAGSSVPGESNQNSLALRWPTWARSDPEPVGATTYAGWVWRLCTSWASCGASTHDTCD
jgi:hypothetical protein